MPPTINFNLRFPRFGFQGKLVLRAACLVILSAIGFSQDLSRVKGFWLGTLTDDGKTRRIQVTFTSGDAGKTACTYDSLDEHAMGMPCESVNVRGDKLSFTVPMLAGTFLGTLSSDNNTVTGTWKQSTAEPLTLKRQLAALPMPPYPPPKYDPAIAPVPAAEMRALLSKELAPQLVSGILAPATKVGMVVGIVDHGRRQILAYGNAKADSIFEIGSVTKTFTALLLAQMVEQGQVRLDEPVRELLPPGTVDRPRGPEITLLDLAIHQSGLPSLPENFKPADAANPFADYHPANLYAYMKGHGVVKPPTAKYLYSNLAYGLLGQALSNRAGLPYAELIHEEIEVPLGLADTAVALSPTQRQRFLTPYESPGHAAHSWDLDALAGAGALRSSAQDLLTYVGAYLHPDRLPPGAKTGRGATLSAALRQSLVLRDEPKPGMWNSLAWGYKQKDENYFHDGGTGGFTSCVLFNPKRDYGVVVLMNVEADYGMLAENLCWHISQRLQGQPALSLEQ